jgi:glycosyltransferase involved in cell wall biosynthesis
MVPVMRSNKIRLLKVLTNFHIGGTERQVANLSQRIDACRFDLHLGCLRYSGQLLEELKSLDIPLPEFRIGSFHSPRTLWQGMRFTRYVWENRIQIVHSYGFYSNMFVVPAARLAGTAIVIASIRDTGDVLTPAQRRAQRIVCKAADCVLVNADAIREKLVEEGYDPGKIVVIRNGIILSRFDKKRGSAHLREELGLPLAAPLVIVSSRLNRMKGIEYFLDAAVILAARFPEVHFLIVGDGDSRKELENYANRLGLRHRVVFTGFRSDVPDVLSEAAVSVLPSLSEGLSNSLLESMAAGVPVVATRVGGNPEVVEHEVSGLLVPPRDSAALADATGRLLEDENMAASFGQACRRRVTELFSMERSVRETEHLYQRLMEACGRP